MGVISSGSLSVDLIGQGPALARGLTPKHAIKLVDRLLSNPGIDMDVLLRLWVRYIVGDSQAIAVALDWTDFDADKQSTLMLSLITNQGRATPLYWLSIDKRTLKDRRNNLEYQLLVRFADALDPKVKVRLVADRGFDDQKVYRLLSEELSFNFVIRFRGNISVTAQDGEPRTAAGWVTASGRARTLPNAAVTRTTPSVP